MRGRYHFKKDSTFTIKIKGRGQELARKKKSSYVTTTTDRRVTLKKIRRSVASLPSLQIKIKGTYSVSDGMITTMVAPEDISCYIDSGREEKEMPSVNNPDYDYDMLVYLVGRSAYNRGESMSRRQEKTIKRELMHVWNWNSEPLEVTTKTMTVGDKVTFKR